MGRMLFILIASISLVWFTYAESELGINSNNNFYEQVIQHSCRDCGLKNMIVACEILGIETITFDKGSDIFKTTNDITMYDLYKIAMNEGLSVQWMGLTMDELGKIESPGIICTIDKHFMVIDRIIGDEVRIIDDKVCYSLTKEEFQKVWDGCALIVSKPDEPIQQHY